MTDCILVRVFALISSRDLVDGSVSVSFYWRFFNSMFSETRSASGTLMWDLSHKVRMTDEELKAMRSTCARRNATAKKADVAWSTVCTTAWAGRRGPTTLGDRTRRKPSLVAECTERALNANVESHLKKRD